MNNKTLVRPVYITASYQVLYSKEPNKEPRSRFIEYYEDLYGVYKKALDYKTFREGSQCSYTDLGSLVLDECSKDNMLHDTGLMIFPIWTHEFDPDHSSCGSYFAHKYSFAGKFFDICDQGSIASFTAFHVASLYLNDMDYSKAVIVGLEQTTIPRDSARGVVMPSLSGGSAIFLQNNIKNLHYPFYLRLVLSKIINRYSSQIDIFSELASLCSLCNINMGNIGVVMKEDSELWGAYKKTATTLKPSLHSTMELFDNKTGVLPVLLYLHALFNMKSKPPDFRYIALLDVDAESLDVGLMILEITDS